MQGRPSGERPCWRRIRKANYRPHSPARFMLPAPAKFIGLLLLFSLGDFAALAKEQPQSWGENLASLPVRWKAARAELRACGTRLGASAGAMAALVEHGKTEEAQRLKAAVEKDLARVEAIRKNLVRMAQEFSTARDDGIEVAGNDERPMAPGDILTIWTSEACGLGEQTTVRVGGYVLLGGIGRLQVVGKTASQVEALILKALIAKNQKVDVVAVEYLAP
jgi:hypothetical protein